MQTTPHSPRPFLLLVLLLLNSVLGTAHAQPIIEWDKTLGGSSWDELNTLQQTSDGGYILGGISESDSGFEKSQNSRGGSDYWVVKLDASGNKQWDKTLGGGLDDNLWSLQQTADGGYILGGRSSSGVGAEKSEDNRGSLDYWVVKLDATGTKKWDKTLGGDGWDDLWSLQQTDDGGYILGGWSFSDASDEKSENSRGKADCWVVKLGDLRPNLGPDRPWCRWTNQDATLPTYPPTANNPVLTGPAGTGLSYRWWRNSMLLNGETGRTLGISQSGEYVLEVISAGSAARDTVVLTRYDEEPFTLTSTSTSEPRLCPGETQTWVGPSGDFAYTWEWARAPDFSQVIATTRQIALTQPGSYRLTAIDSCGNYYRDSVVITQQADPTTLSLNLPPLYDRCIQQGRPLQAPEAPGLSYRWTD
ncbi:MAG: hypothetical protein ACK5QE_00995, partial [Sphingobacteriia bacterium]